MNFVNITIASWDEWIFYAGWQAGVAAGLIAIILRLLQNRISPQLKYALLLLLLLKFVIPPFLRLPDSMPALPVMPAAAQTIEFIPAVVAGDFGNSSRPKTMPPAIKPQSPRRVIETSDPEFSVVPIEPTAPLVFRWQWFLLTIHLCGMMVSFCILIRQFRQVRQVIRQATVVVDGSLVATVCEISRQLKLKKSPSIRISDDFDSPFATGLFQPVIVLPHAMTKRLDQDQLHIVIAHELAHIRRHDLIVGWIEVLLSVVWWFHPAMWWLKRALRETREDCCDDILLAQKLTTPERYCQTLIDAATRQIRPVCEPIALGFASSEHSVGRRMRRLMDPSRLRSDRLKRPALVLTIILGFVLLPGLRPERGSVTKTTLKGWFGWRHLSFDISQEEEDAVKECANIAQTYHSTRNNKREIDRPDTRIQLERILEQHPDFFYAQHLLATWHRRNGDPDDADRLFQAALENAPVVLTRRFRTGGGNGVPGIEIPGMKIECNRVQNGSLDPSLKLQFVNLVTDDNGEVHLPVYDTVYRVSSQAWPAGYHLEVTENLGWFQSKYRTGVLPEALIWVPYSKPRNFTRKAEETSLLRNATGTQTERLTVDENDFTLGSVARAQKDKTFVIQDGYGARLSNPVRELPGISNSRFMDHAVIDLSSPDPDLFDIAQGHLLDSQTKIPLHQFQGGAGFLMSGKHRFHLFAVGAPLPETVDLALQIYNYGKDRFRFVIPPEVGTTVTHAGVRFQITYLERGHHHGWSSAGGFLGDPEQTSTSSEILFQLVGQSEQRFSVWVVLKDGRRWSLRGISRYYSAGSIGGPERLYAALEDIDYFELLPFVEAETIYFENIQLPDRQESLDQDLPTVQFPVNRLPREFVSDLFSPIQIHFQSRRGKTYSGIGSSNAGTSLHERTINKQKRKTHTTIVWSTNAEAAFANETLFHVLTDDGVLLPSGNRRSLLTANNRWGFTAIDCRKVPLKKLHSVTLQLSPKTPE